MRSSVQRLALAGLAAALASLPLRANAQQKAQASARSVLFGIGVGQTFPTGEFGADNKPGLNFAGFVQFRKPESLMGLRGELQFSKNDMKESLLSDLGALPGTTGYFGTLYAGVAGVLESMKPGSGLGWYLLAGGGMYRIEPTRSDAGVNTSLIESRVGFNAGGGLRARVGAASLYFEARYHGAKIDSGNYTFFPVTIGIAY